MYMWNQVNCAKNHYGKVGEISPYKQWLYPKVSCPHQDRPVGDHGQRAPAKQVLQWAAGSCGMCGGVARARAASRDGDRRR